MCELSCPSVASDLTYVFFHNFVVIIHELILRKRFFSSLTLQIPRLLTTDTVLVGGENGKLELADLGFIAVLYYLT